MQAVPAALNVVPPAVAGYVPAGQEVTRMFAPAILATSGAEVPPAHVEPRKGGG